MGRASITSLDVAKRAGVSQSAVSRVFTPGASVSKHTAEKVRKAAQELNYRPNILARAMVSSKTRMIGLVVAYLENQFYPVALELLSKLLQEKGYKILIFMAKNSEESVETVLQDLMDYQVDGIIAASVSISSSLANRVEKRGIPVVLFNRGQTGSHFATVTSANKSGGAKIAKFLLQNGHRHIAHIAGFQGSTTGRDRKSGFLSILDQAGIEPLAVMDGLYQRDIAMRCTWELLSRRQKPDAIFAGNDHMAFAVIDVLREAHITPGRDISVIGYDDVPLAAWGAYRLTTMRQPVHRMVQTTIDYLLALIHGEETTPFESLKKISASKLDENIGTKTIEIEGDLIIRDSARQSKTSEEKIWHRTPAHHTLYFQEE